MVQLIAKKYLSDFDGYNCFRNIKNLICMSFGLSFPPPPPPHPPGSFNFLRSVYSNFPPLWAKCPLPPGTNVIKISEKKVMVYYFLVPPLGFWLVSITLWCENHEKQTLHPWILSHQTIKCIPLESLDTSSSHLNWLAHNHNHLVIITGLDANHHGSEQL